MLTTPSFKLSPFNIFTKSGGGVRADWDSGIRVIPACSYSDFSGAITALGPQTNPRSPETPGSQLTPRELF